jgi:hypothetical protein
MHDVKAVAYFAGPLLFCSVAAYSLQACCQSAHLTRQESFLSGEVGTL